MKKNRLLCVLHRSPPTHGAAKVGDFVSTSAELNDEFDCHYITIKSSETIGDIGNVNFKKLYLVTELYFKVLVALLMFRPQKVYFTSSISGVAFYRDLLISTLWKTYKLFKHVDIYYHYHTKGINSFVSNSWWNLILTNFFVKGVNLVLLSPMLKSDIDKINTYKKIIYLPNGVEDVIKSDCLEKQSLVKYNAINTVEVLYLAHMMKEKGYWDVLVLANKYKAQNIHFKFAGSWPNKGNKVEFYNYINKNSLQSIVTYYGFVSGDEKKSLFTEAHLLIYPSKNDAFPLTLLESLSYGVPVISTHEGSIPDIIDQYSGIVIDNTDKLPEALEQAMNKLINQETAEYCRQRYLDNFSLEQFEINLVEVLK
jgi:glycosyltransferase involved in cell wall biosynthesis